jgi:tetratricopeptide (TPR) repeat protein
MDMAKRILRFSVCMFIVAALSGCAALKTNMHEDVYHPEIKPEATWETAVSDLLNTLHENQLVFLDLSTQYQEATGRVVAAVKCDIDNNTIALRFQSDGRLILQFAFYRLLGYTLVVKPSPGNGIPSLVLPDLMTLRFSKMDDAKTVANALYFIQQDLDTYRSRLDKQLKDFYPLAAEYRTLQVKPGLSEAQRGLMAEADAQHAQKQYFNARQKYREAIELDRTSCPEAYRKLALLEAQINLPFAAVTYMKQYLLLVPDAKDAGISKDKIDEWQNLMALEFKKEAFTRLTTEPSDAFLELNVSDSGRSWAYIGRAPGVARFWRSDPNLRFCLIRATKPGYLTEEKSFSFESLPKTVHLQLQSADSGQDSLGYVGIRFEEITVKSTKPPQFPFVKKMLIKEVEKDSPADHAGMQPGDILHSFNSREIKEQIDLPLMVASTPVGEEANIKIFRNGKELDVKIKIGERPDFHPGDKAQKEKNP